MIHMNDMNHMTDMNHMNHMNHMSSLVWDSKDEHRSCHRYSLSLERLFILVCSENKHLIIFLVHSKCTKC